MKITLNEKVEIKDQSHSMKSSSSSANLLAYKSSYANNNLIMNKICIIIRWKTGICMLMSFLLFVCLLKLYMASLTSDPNIGEFHETLPQVSTKSEKFYGIMLDAGSTGSRIHVYEFKYGGQNSAPILLDELFEKINPGLSSFADKPEEGADSIKKLLDIAKQRVPKSEWKKTPMSLKATAGLRLLPIEKAEALLKQVEKLFHQYPFVLDQSPVMIMDGSDEGVFGWISVNYLLNRLGTNSNQFTVGCIDLGGGSMQITFAPHDMTTVRNASKHMINEVNIFGSKIKVYTHSYLGFGLMSAREATMSGENNNNIIAVKTACMPHGYHGEWSNGPRKYEIEGATGIEETRYQLCKMATDKAIEGKLFHPIEINHHNFYIFSYFFDRASQANLIDAKTGGKISPKQFANAAKVACTDDAFDKENPFFCMDLCILSSILEVGFQFSPNTEFQSIRTVDGKETSWTLGATFALLNNS